MQNVSKKTLFTGSTSSFRVEATWRRKSTSLWLIEHQVNAGIKFPNHSILNSAFERANFPNKDGSRLCATMSSISMDTLHQTAPESTRGLFDLPEHVSNVSNLTLFGNYLLTSRGLIIGNSFQGRF
jgi:hypothetical protein